MPKVLVPLAQGCEEMEAVIIIDLLRRAGIEVVTAGLDGRPVTASRKVRLLPDTVIDQVMDEDFDMIVLPGGLPGADNLNEDKHIQQILKRLAAQGKYTAAICAAPKVLASAGLLENKKATAYPGVLDKMHLSTTQCINSPVVQDETVITSRGPGTAMDFGLSLIGILKGEKKRHEVEAGLVRS